MQRWVGGMGNFFGQAAEGAAQAPALFSGEQGQGEVFGGCGAAARGFLEGGVAAVEGVLGLAAVEDLLDGEDLEAGVGCAV